ncbi:Uncharacterised protein [Rikenella microfusus]|uniref:Uncharacterized protein n=1 Tax=Rikenella microfusus TaxID=28139 RepID=A0A379MVX3_9BACT|nr:Uncharacterised protein [Rikenella microfusus]
MPVRTVRNNSPRQRAGRTFPYEPPGTGRARAATVRFVCRRSQKVIPNWPLRGQITVVLTVCLSLTGVYFSLSAHATGHRFLRTPYAGETSPFSSDQKRRQKTRRECDSPLPTSVGTEKHTCPGYQPLSYFGYKVRRWKKEFLNLRLIIMFSLSQAGATPGVGLQRRGACCGPTGSGRQL